MRVPLPTGLMVVAVGLTSIVGTPSPAPAQDDLPAPVKSALDRITADSLKGHVSFLASDLLEGRGTPSRGLDIAAEYIAAQFRRAGLEPIGDDGYFQTAPWKYLAPEPGTVSAELKVGDDSIPIAESQFSGSVTRGIQLAGAKVVKLSATDMDAIKELKEDDVSGSVVLAEVPNPAAVPREKAMQVNTARFGFLSAMARFKPALILDIDRDPRTATGLRQDLGGRRRSSGGPPTVRVHSARVAAAFDKLPAGLTKATLSIKVGEPKEQTAKVRNVIGLLKGSDPKLSQTYVLITAHYDHLGIYPHDGSGDVIRNGANDDASGTASVVEIASALATLPVKPKRSIVFMTFYGEEHGLIGSQYYGEHPVVPIKQTVAAVNLEQLGRTDDTEGARVAAANITGYDYSNVTTFLKDAGASVGVKIEKHPTNSDRFFFASDNAALAAVGIPAHTISVAYVFPDYHQAGDEWSKLDYANMARIDRMAALGLYRIAESPEAPRWDETNEKTKRYREKR